MVYAVLVVVSVGQMLVVVSVGVAAVGIGGSGRCSVIGRGVGIDAVLVVVVVGWVGV